MYSTHTHTYWGIKPPVLQQLALPQANKRTATVVAQKHGPRTNARDCGRRDAHRVQSGSRPHTWAKQSDIRRGADMLEARTHPNSRTVELYAMRIRSGLGRTGQHHMPGVAPPHEHKCKARKHVRAKGLAGLMDFCVGWGGGRAWALFRALAHADAETEPAPRRTPPAHTLLGSCLGLAAHILHTLPSSS
eukprot:593893-Prymnesium_polylepis.1